MLTLTIAAVALNMSSQGLNTKFDSLNFVGRPVSEVVDYLSKESGVTLIASGSIQSEPILLNLKNKSVLEVMDLLATVTYGQWKEGNGAWTLSQGSHANEASEKARIRREAAIRESIGLNSLKFREVQWGAHSAGMVADEIEKQRDRFKNSFGVPEGERATVSISGPDIKGPINYLVASAIESLNPQALSFVKRDQRIVFSTHPNRTQLALPGNIASAISQYIKSYAEIYDEVQKKPRKDFGADWEGSLGYPKVRNLIVAKVNVVVHREDSQIIVEVQIVGSNGEDLGTKSVSINSDPNQMTVADSESSVQDDAIPLSALSQEFLSLNGDIGQRSAMSMLMRTEEGLVQVDAGQAPTTVRPSANLQKVLSKPGNHDFFELFLPEILEKIFQGGDFVALVPDKFWEDVSSQSRPTSILSTAVRRILNNNCEETALNGVSTLRPVDPIDTQSIRIDRANLQLFTDKVYATKFGHIQDIAQYVVNRGRQVKSTDADARVMTLSMPFVSRQLLSFPPISFELAKVLFEAPDFVREFPTGQQEWKVGSLKGSLRQTASQLIFARPAPNVSTGGISIGVSTGRNEAPVPLTMDFEPTERFPNGVTDDATITFNIVESEGVLGCLRGHPTGQLMSAIQFGAISGFIEGSGGANGEMKITEFEEFYSATTRSVEVRVPGTFAQSNFVDGRLTPNSRAMAYHELDPAFIQKGQSVREAMRDAAQNMLRQRGSEPPPSLQ